MATLSDADTSYVAVIREVETAHSVSTREEEGTHTTAMRKAEATSMGRSLQPTTVTPENHVDPGR